MKQGTYIRTEETKLKQRIKAIERYKVPENNPNYKDGRSLEIHYCPDCKEKNILKEITYISKRCRSCASKLQLSLNNHLVLFDRSGINNPMYGVSRYGYNNPNWHGGKSFEPYPLGWNKTFKEQIRYRDNYKCQECGTPEVECCRKLCIHHIDYNKQNLDPNNLISLCCNCHAKTSATKEEKKVYWINYYRQKISDRKN